MSSHTTNEGVMKSLRLLTLAAAVGVSPGPLAAQPKPAPIAPVRVTDARPETKLAVKPKELGAAVKKGLEYLVKNQQEDGGWHDGGIALARGTGRTDVANTSVALLALVRAGNTPAEGQYRYAVAKGLKYVLAKVENADKDSLPLGTVTDTLLKTKFGPAVDTFLAAWLLAELRGKAGDQEKSLVAALEKLAGRLSRHQSAAGWFADTGMTPTLSLGLANTAIARAAQSGVAFDTRVLERATGISVASARGTVTLTHLGPVETPAEFWRAFEAASKPGGSAIPKLGGLGDAGLTLYRVAQGSGNTQELVNALRTRAASAQVSLKSLRATRADRLTAQQSLDTLKRAEVANDQIQAELAKRVRDDAFVAGFGSNGGEEFLSFLNISEAFLARGGKTWEAWDARMAKELEKTQERDGSWSGHHCVTGKTFCTSAALLVLTADRKPFPIAALAR
jgi:hypothetical protein